MDYQYPASCNPPTDHWLFQYSVIDTFQLSCSSAFANHQQQIQVGCWSCKWSVGCCGSGIYVSGFICDYIHQLRMQTFKEIPFQNYIELKFNPKNLNELAQNEALIKYKRNAQLLAQIFTLQTKTRELHPSQDSLSKEQIDQIAQGIAAEQSANLAKIERTRELSKKYEELNSNIKDIKTKDELFGLIQRLKASKLYDDSHPYFVADSPFYLATTEEDCLEVTKPVDFNDDGLTFYEIN